MVAQVIIMMIKMMMMMTIMMFMMTTMMIPVVLLKMMKGFKDVSPRERLLISLNNGDAMKRRCSAINQYARRILKLEPNEIVMCQINANCIHKNTLQFFS